MDHAGRLLRRARRVVVLTGAGISTDSGIPDFRGPEGLWTKNPAAEKAANIEVYVGDPEVRRRSWRNRLTSPMWDSEPNAGHRALVDLERSGRLDTLVTQNIDGLHQKAGNDPSLVIEIHGTSLEVVCLRCGDRQPCAPVHERVRAGEDDPTCLRPMPEGGVESAPCLRRDPQVGHDQLRAVPGPRGPQARRTTRRHGATSSWPWARRSASSPPPVWFRLPCGTAQSW